MAFDQAIADRICERLALGESLRSVCRDEGMPNASTIIRWAETEPFSQQYARAREIGYSLLAEDLLAIADDGTGDSWVDDEGQVRTNNDVIARSRLRVDTRKWMLSKMLPKVYGEKVDVNHAGTMNVKLDTGDGGIL
jgi:hypothetical protein